MLKLSIGPDFNVKQISGFYTRLLRDEVVAEWRSSGSGLGAAGRTFELHVFCHVSGQEKWLAPPLLRNYIFRREMPLVLDTLAYADRELLQAQPSLAQALVYIHFHSSVQELDTVECWGVLGDRSTWREGPTSILLRMIYAVIGWPPSLQAVPADLSVDLPGGPLAARRGDGGGGNSSSGDEDGGAAVARPGAGVWPAPTASTSARPALPLATSRGVAEGGGAGSPVLRPAVMSTVPPTRVVAAGAVLSVPPKGLGDVSSSVPAIAPQPSGPLEPSPMTAQPLAVAAALADTCGTSSGTGNSSSSVRTGNGRVKHPELLPGPPSALPGLAEPRVLLPTAAVTGAVTAAARSDAAGLGKALPMSADDLQGADELGALSAVPVPQPQLVAARVRAPGVR